MFIALAERRRKLDQARAEGRAVGVAEGRAESRRETAAMLDVLNAAARANPDLLPHLLREYQAWYQNRATGQQRSSAPPGRSTPAKKISGPA